MTWLREAISDENGIADMAYISIGAIAALLVGTVVFLCTMSTVSYSRCVQIDATVAHGVLTAPCVFEPQPLALGIAAAIGAFGAPIGALAGYMAATRRPARIVPDKPAPGTVTVAGPTGVTTIGTPPPAVAAAPVPLVARKRKKRRR